MRDRDRILGSLESVYRSAFGQAEQVGDEGRMRHLDFEFQRDQVFLEVLLDLRDLLSVPAEGDDEKSGSLLDKAQALRNLTRLR